MTNTSTTEIKWNHTKNINPQDRRQKDGREKKKPLKKEWMG